MQAVVMPCCPYCHTKYQRQQNDRIEKATTTKSILIRCQRCNERYYVGQQIRYVSRRQPA